MAEPALRVGVLGAADIARRRVLPALAAEPEAEVVAVASRSLDRAAALAGRFGGRPVEGYDALLAMDAVDAVYVPLPVALHAEWVERALRAGKHVLSEKPLTGDPLDTARLLRLARENGLVLMENVMFVHHQQHGVVRRLVEDGAIGAVRAFSAAFAMPPRPAGDIRYRPELGGGALLDVGYYPVRAALHLLGDGLRVVGATLERPAGSAVETSGAALLRTPDGVTVHLVFGMEHSYRSAYELWGSEGHIRVEPAFTPPADHRAELRLLGPHGPRELLLGADDQVAGTVRAFVAAVRAGAVDESTEARCLQQARLLDEIRRRAEDDRQRSAWGEDTADDRHR
ncbi:Gfo/Idh/MocA family oxidoreductase [Streptacidiphilus sp. ASG 303]|uniref:Gfo/Idh/MocA family protein n=1 Tax=Streptacidiphilus sp. ASG 303 TaxID=2896847 RepID=UPI001E2EC99D|nr:Gfo/Idh/MocA family oxidoreductase [Streptacidiphilus sp. ASG 303]MCD0485132.1 Gfo/Idh/MocA family oxidoreductase [Streptacidiphilus sp. ASG 303]